jgi:ParB-like chromosome segregation protein Spo0J
MRCRFWPADQLRLEARNLRRHSPRKLAALTRSIATFGVFVPIVVDPTGKVLSGRARLACAIELGLREIPVIVVSHLSDTEKRLFALADARIPELSSWDLPMLKLEIQELSLPDLNLDLSLTGFDTSEIDRNPWICIVRYRCGRRRDSGTRGPGNLATRRLVVAR